MKHRLLFPLLAVSLLSGCGGGGSNVTPPPPISVTVSPASINIHVNNTQQFTATVLNSTNTSVTWSVSGTGCSGAACGTISPTGLYTAPATVPSASATIHVTATSAADTSKSNSAVATVLAAVIVTVTPSPLSIHVTKTQQFTATVQNAINSAVTWSVSGTGCTGAACGTISTSGIYTAPATLPSPASVNVTATSVEDTAKSGAATTTIVAAIIVTVSPGAPSVLIGTTQQFTATVQNAISNSTVTWSLSCSAAACGSITNTGLFTPPVPIPVPATVTVKATSVEDSLQFGSTSAAITSNIFVLTWPTQAQVTVNALRQFGLLVTGSSITAVNWTVSGAGCSGNTCGTISNAGQYTAPGTVPNPANITITATSQADPGKSATATVELMPNDNAKLNGTYAFFTQGYAAGAPGQTGGVLVADGHGNITSGAIDRTWPNSVGGNLQNVTFSGIYSIGSDNRGTITINATNGSFTNITYAIVLNATGDEACMQSFFNVNTGLMGELVKQDPSALNNAGIKGDYVFQMTGNDSTYARQAQLGRFHADGNGNITAGNLDLNDGVNVTTNLPFTGTYLVSSNGRTTLALTVSGHGVLNYVGYLLSTDLFYLMSSDTIATNTPMMGGTALLQASLGGFANASLDMTTVFQLSGLPAAGHPRVTVGLLTGQGNGNITGVADIADTTMSLNNPYTASYTIDATGRGTITPNLASLPNMIFYMVTPNQGLLMEASTGPGTALATGTFEPQVQIPYNVHLLAPWSNAFMIGHYMGYTPSVLYSGYDISTGTVDCDGAGGANAAAEINSTAMGLWHWTGTDTYSVAASGHVVTAANAAGYLVSPVKYVIIHWPDNQAHLNIAEQ